jgi:alkane 1-monooxygenase
MGCQGGLVFTASHELIHSRRASDRMLGDALLASMFYMHWYAACVLRWAYLRSYITHSVHRANAHRAHHIKVATPDDPATARLDESLYAFLPRCIAGALRDGVDMELQRLHTTNTPWWSPHNQCVPFWGTLWHPPHSSV